MISRSEKKEQKMESLAIIVPCYNEQESAAVVL